MNRSIGAAVVALIVCAACSKQPAAASTSEAEAGIDSLNAKISRAYREKDSRAYAELYTDSAVFEWPAIGDVKGRPQLEAMARDGWKSLDDLALKIIVSSRRVASDHATEFGSFEESWRDPKGLRMTEFGRYVVFLVRRPDNTWAMDRWAGFEDSTRQATTSQTH